MLETTFLLLYFFFDTSSRDLLSKCFVNIIEGQIAWFQQISRFSETTKIGNTGGEAKEVHVRKHTGDTSRVTFESHLILNTVKKIHQGLKPL